VNGRTRPDTQAAVCDACGRTVARLTDDRPECHTRAGDPHTICDGTRPPLTRRIPGATRPPVVPR
jgi:hypothetical protein